MPVVTAAVTQYTSINNDAIRALSANALAAFTFLHMKETFTARDLEYRFRWTVRVRRKTMSELEYYGFLTGVSEMDAEGEWGTEWQIHHEPVKMPERTKICARYK